MGQINSIKIIKKELDSGVIPFNYVMIESDLTIEGKKTQGGIIYGHDEDIIFWSSEENAENAWEADVAQVFGKVYKIPDRLYYNKEDQRNSMPWDCDMELQMEDIVWFPPIESRNATSLECENKYYKLIPYRDLIVAKRKDEVLMLNGYILLEPVYHENKSSLAISEKGEIDKTRGIVRYVGKPNREYLHPDYVDFPNLEVGDEVLLAPNSPLFYLERKSYMAQFDNEKLYWVCQRRRIGLILSKNN